MLRCRCRTHDTYASRPSADEYSGPYFVCVVLSLLVHRTWSRPAVEDANVTAVYRGGWMWFGREAHGGGISGSGTFQTPAHVCVVTRVQDPCCIFIRITSTIVNRLCTYYYINMKYIITVRICQWWFYVENSITPCDSEERKSDLDLLIYIYGYTMLR